MTGRGLSPVVASVCAEGAAGSPADQPAMQIVAQREPVIPPHQRHHPELICARWLRGIRGSRRVLHVSVGLLARQASHARRHRVPTVPAGTAQRVACRPGRLSAESRALVCSVPRHRRCRTRDSGGQLVVNLWLHVQARPVCHPPQLPGNRCGMRSGQQLVEQITDDRVPLDAMGRDQLRLAQRRHRITAASPQL